MSLSKPVARIGPTPTSLGLKPASQSEFPFSFSSRPVQLGFLIGVPVALVTAVGIYYWWSLKSGRKSTKKDKPDPGSKSASKTFLSSKDGSDKPVHVRIKEEGNDLFRSGDYAAALEAYARAINESPPGSDLSTLYQNRAAVFEKLGDWVQVVREASAALKLNPRYLKALQRRSKALRRTGFSDEALEDITAVCILEGFQHQSSIQTADEILKEIGLREADKLMKTKKPSAPSHHAVASFLRAFYSDPVTKWWNKEDVTPLVNGDKGEGEVGENEQKPGGDSESPEPTKGFVAALDALQAGNYDSIIDLCTEELSNSDTKYTDETYLLRGTFRFLWGFGEEVLEDLNKVTESETAGNDMKSSAWVKKGLRHSLVNDEEGYNDCFKKAEDLCQENVDIYHQKGQCLLTKGDFQEATNLIDKAHKLCPEFGLAAASKWYTEYRIASRVQDTAGISNALKQFNKCIRKFPKVADIYNLYGQILMELGQFNEADQQFDTVIKLDPTNAAVYVHKAMAQYQLTQNMPEILTLLRASLKIDDKNEFVYETIGTLELQAGNLDSAIEAISKALELARTKQELMMLSSLKKAAEVQCKMKNELGIDFPSMGAMPSPLS